VAWPRAAALAALPVAAIGAARGLLLPPSGDEPHYLVISESLARHGSLAVQRVYDERGYAAFYPLPLEPHVVAGPDGVPLPLHAVGGPLLWLLPYALAGRAGVLAFMVVVTLLVVHTVERLLRELGTRPGLTTGVAVATGLGTPLLWYAGMTFVEPIGALGCVLGLRVLHQRELRPRDLALAGAALGVLPWVHGRFLWFALALGVLLALRVARRHRAWLPALLVPLGILGAALVVYDLAVWHTVSPVANQVGGGAVPFRVDPGVPLVGLLVDQEAGIVPSFPVVLLVLPGLLLGARAPVTRHVLVLVVPYVLTVASFEAWDGAWSPPARFLAVVVPLFSWHVALAVERAGRVGTALLGTFTGLAVAAAAIAVVTPTGGFSTALRGSPVLAAVAAATGLDLHPYVPSVALPGRGGVAALLLVARRRPGAPGAGATDVPAAAV
jgi:hypothetical protein